MSLVTQVQAKHCASLAHVKVCPKLGPQLILAHFMIILPFLHLLLGRTLFTPSPEALLDLSMESGNSFSLSASYSANFFILRAGEQTKRKKSYS